MGLFDKIFKKENVKVADEAHSYFKTLTAYRPVFTTWNGSLYESALVRSAIDARARSVSKLKIEILGNANLKLQTQLSKRPNSWQTWSQFMYRASTILDMDNNLIIVPIYNDYMDVVGYYPILPRKCEIVEYKDEAWLRYRFKSGAEGANRLSECALLTRFQYESDFFGSSNNALEPTMKLIHLQDEGIKEAVKNGATFRFMARVTNFTKPDDLANERKRFNEENLKNEDGGGILLMPNTYTDIKQLDSKPYTVNEAEINNINRNVMNYFGVNEEVLQSLATGDKWSAFYESVIEPFAIQFSETMTNAIFTDREIANGAQLIATANRLQYMTTQEKLNVSSQMADRGIMNRDEIREIWNLPPLPNGEGQAYTIRGEYYLLNGEESQSASEASEGGQSNE